MLSTLDSILAFLDEIKLLASEGVVPPDSCLPGIRVSRGMLVFDRATLRWPGDLLHEAGHIAVTPSSLRAALDDALDSSDSVPHAGEAEATAWAYVAIVRAQAGMTLVGAGASLAGVRPYLTVTRWLRP